MSEWINNASNCGIPQFEKCADTMQNWLAGILNSFSSPYTNGFTEGCNNKIKVLKRNAYGYKNFRRFRNRILHIFSHKQLNKEKQLPNSNCLHSNFHFISLPQLLTKSQKKKRGNSPPFGGPGSFDQPE